MLVFGWLCCVAEVEEPSCGNWAGFGGKGATGETSFRSASPKPTGYHRFFLATSARAGGVGDTIQYVHCHCRTFGSLVGSQESPVRQISPRTQTDRITSIGQWTSAFLIFCVNQPDAAPRPCPAVTEIRRYYPLCGLSSRWVWFARLRCPIPLARVRVPGQALTLNCGLFYTGGCSDTT